VLPSSFTIGAGAQASIAASGLAAAELWHRAGAPRQQVGVDMHHAAIEFCSERYLSIDAASRRKAISARFPGSTVPATVAWCGCT
jgi:hypothetical protein